MNQLIKLILQYQNSNSDEIFEKIVNKLMNLIKFYSNKMKKNKDDLYQELLMKLHYVTTKFQIIDYYEKSNEINLNLIKEKIIRDKYINGFILKYGEDYFDNSFKNKENLENFLMEYNLFCNENQFIKYLNKTFKNTVISFYKKESANQIRENIDYILINENIKENNEKINWDEMTSKEKKILEYFYIFNKTEKEVSSIIGISQQGVNKRKRKILEKYKIKQK